LRVQPQRLAELLPGALAVARMQQLPCTCGMGRGAFRCESKRLGRGVSRCIVPPDQRQRTRPDVMCKCALGIERERNVEIRERLPTPPGEQSSLSSRDKAMGALRVDREGA